jgi:hypothetical protein
VHSTRVVLLRACPGVRHSKPAAGFPQVDAVQLIQLPQLGRLTVSRRRWRPGQCRYGGDAWLPGSGCSQAVRVRAGWSWRAAPIGVTGRPARLPAWRRASVRSACGVQAPELTCSSRPAGPRRQGAVREQDLDQCPGAGGVAAGAAGGVPVRAGGRGWKVGRRCLGQYGAAAVSHMARAGRFRAVSAGSAGHQAVPYTWRVPGSQAGPGQQAGLPYGPASTSALSDRACWT